MAKEVSAEKRISDVGLPRFRRQLNYAANRLRTLSFSSYCAGLT